RQRKRQDRRRPRRAHRPARVQPLRRDVRPERREPGRNRYARLRHSRRGDPLLHLRLDDAPRHGHRAGPRPSLHGPRSPGSHRRHRRRRSRRGARRRLVRGLPLPAGPPAGVSFVTSPPLPVRHGLTLGELATLLNADDHLGVALSIVTMRGWRRGSYGDETGLPWVNPSPNLRSVAEALLYPALGLLEATNLSVGRGTDAPFERVGAPWIDGAALADALAADALPGVAFAPDVFTPQTDRYAGQSCSGVRVVVGDRPRFEPVRTGLAIARELRRLYPRAW